MFAGNQYYDGPAFFPVAPNVVIVHLWTGARSYHGASAINSGSSGIPNGVGFDETFPAQLQQVWSLQQWQAFISASNSIVSNSLGNLYRKRYLMVILPFVLLVSLMIISMIITISTNVIFVGPIILFPAFFGVIAWMTWFGVNSRRKLLAVMEELGVHCRATSQTSPQVQWSVKSMRTRRTTSVWLQGDIQLHVSNNAQSYSATAGPYPPPQTSPYPYPANHAPATGTPLPSYASSNPMNVTPTTSATPWPVTAGGAKVVKGSDGEGKAADDLDWPV